MTKQRYIAVPLLILALAAAPTLAQGAQVPCSGKRGCRFHLTVERKVQEWASKGRPAWRQSGESRGLAVYVEGVRLAPGLTVRSCLAEFIGHGVSVRVNICNPARLKLKWVAWGRPTSAVVYLRV